VTGRQGIVARKTIPFDIGIPAESFRGALVYPSRDPAVEGRTADGSRARGWTSARRHDGYPFVLDNQGRMVVSCERDRSTGDRYGPVQSLDVGDPIAETSTLRSMTRATTQRALGTKPTLPARPPTGHTFDSTPA
jgi:hypothetical protein